MEYFNQCLGDSVEFLKNKICIIDNFLSDKEITSLIYYHENNRDLIEKWPPIEPIDLNILFPEIRKKYNSLNKNINVDWWQVVKWPTKSSQPLHYDSNAPNKTPPLTSITYLNENFKGGETFFSDGTIVKPKKGRILMFNGLNYKHGVKRVIKGVRWTVPVWYKNID